MEIQTETQPRDATERKLKRVKISLLRNDKFAFWRGVMMIGKTELRDDVPTACTDGCNEYYGRPLVDMLTEPMLGFVVLHENWHKLERHLSTWKKMFEDDPELANLACDYRINQMLVDMDPTEQTIAFPRTPDGAPLGVLDARFKGLDIPNIFRILKKEKQDQPGGGQGQGQPGQPGKGNAKGGQPSKNFDTHDWGKADERTKEEQDKLEKEIDQALRQGEMEHRRLNGDGVGNLARELSELLKPQIDWREVLAEFVRSTCAGRDKSSWRRPNRRYIAQDILLPSLVSERVGKMAIGIDTSGSIQGAALTSLVSEVATIAREVRPEKIDLLYWDAKVARHEEYDESNMDLLPTSTKPAGGGGTNVNCFFNFIKDKLTYTPECAIILTDGYTPWPSTPPDYPVLWVITTKNITAPFGVTVHMNETNNN